MAFSFEIWNGNDYHYIYSVVLSILWFDFGFSFEIGVFWVCYGCCYFLSLPLLFRFLQFYGFSVNVYSFSPNVYSFSTNVRVLMCYLMFLIQVQNVCKGNGVWVYYYCLLLILFFNLMIFSDFCRRSSVVPFWRFWSKFQKIFWHF